MSTFPMETIIAPRRGIAKAQDVTPEKGGQLGRHETTQWR